MYIVPIANEYTQSLVLPPSLDSASVNPNTCKRYSSQSLDPIAQFLYLLTSSIVSIKMLMQNDSHICRKVCIGAVCTQSNLAWRKF